MSIAETAPPGGPSVSDPPAPASDDVPARRGHGTILVVDDEPDARAYMKTFLEAEGYEYMHSPSGAPALRLVEAHKPDLVIVDFMMPGMTGLELCAKLRARPDMQRVPIIVFSAYPLNPRSSEGLYDHAILKPADFEHLLLAIRSLLPRGVNRGR
jgi:two-component system, OmpR family, phosphate regulon response regulator PhoB